MMTKKYFNDNMSASELKKAYHEFSKKLHPDNGGDAEEFKRMSAEYAERTQGCEAEQRRKARARRDAEEEARKKAEETAKKSARKTAQKPVFDVEAAMRKLKQLKGFHTSWGNLKSVQRHDGYIWKMGNRRVFEAYVTKNGVDMYVRDDLFEAVKHLVPADSWQFFKSYNMKNRATALSWDEASAIFQYITEVYKNVA